MKRSLAAAGLLLASCAGLPPIAGTPVPGPAGEGRVSYAVGRLSFEAPGAWRARGDGREVRVEAADGSALIVARAVEPGFPSESQCLARAEESLARGAAAFRNARRHPTTFAGLPAVTQEGAGGGWHGWAFAACDGGRQYRVVFNGVSPLSPQAMEAYRALVSSARMGGGP